MQIHHYEHGIHAIDSGYYRPDLDAIHFIVDGGEVAVIDTGTNHSVARIVAALDELGCAPEAVRHVLLTHVHLDHAAGAGSLMQRLPNARLAVHARGARHLSDPRKLWDATVAVYGEAHVMNAYGALAPVPPERIEVVPDLAVLDLGRRQIQVLDTPGHARHHVVYHDSASGHVFCGDIFGLSYRELDRDGQAFIIPTSSPSQFDPQEAHQSIDRILALAPEAVYLTHFAQVRTVPRLGAQLHRMLDAYAALAERCRDTGDARYSLLHEGMKAIVLNEAHRAGWQRHDEQRLLDVLGLDIELNAQGLVSWLEATTPAGR